MRRIMLAFFSTGITQLMNFASGILLARLLGPQMRGEVSQIIAWFGFIGPIAMLGINDGVTFFRSRNPETSGEVLATALRLTIGTTLLGAFFCTLAILLPLSRTSAITQAAAWLFLLYVPLYQLQKIAYSYFQAGPELNIWTFVQCIPGIVYVTGLGSLAIWGNANSLTVIIAYLVSFASAVAVAFGYIARSRVRLERPSTEFRQAFIRFSAPLVTQRIAVVSRDNLDRMVLPFFISATALGHYVVASSVAYLVFVAGMTIDLVTFPALARAKDDVARRHAAEFFIAATFWLLIVTVVVLVPLRKPVVYLLFGPDYAASADLVPYFLVAGALQALRMVFGGVFKAFQRPRALAGIEMTSAVVMLVLLFALAPWFGVYAGALTHLLSAALSAGIAGYLAVRSLGLSPVRLVVPRSDDLRRVWAQWRAAVRDVRGGGVA